MICCCRLKENYFNSVFEYLNIKVDRNLEGDYFWLPRLWGHSGHFRPDYSVTPFFYFCKIILECVFPLTTKKKIKFFTFYLTCTFLLLLEYLVLSLTPEYFFFLCFYSSTERESFQDLWWLITNREHSQPTVRFLSCRFSLLNIITSPWGAQRLPVCVKS